MSIRRKIIDYSRGNHLGWFWRLYQLQKKVNQGFLHDILTFFLSRCAHRHGGYIGPDTVIKSTLSLPHGLHGIFISRYAEIGENCRIYQNVTIGEINKKAPVIGDGCLIGAGAVIIGDIKIGNYVRIGAGAVVNTDIPDYCTVVAQPARMIERKQRQDTAWKTERAWIEVNVKNLRHNVEILQNAMPPKCKLMAVVKAEAYGHGAVEISGQLNKMGILSFAVATIDEGIKLRKHGICGEILILGYTSPNRASELKKYDLTQTLIDYTYAKDLNSRNVAVKAHIKIDTGMHRLGIAGKEISNVEKIFSMQNISVRGIYTHLCCADSRLPDDVAFTRWQIARFYGLADALKKRGIRIPKLHIQSSYGLLNYPDLACDYVRAGIALYGALSSPNDTTALKLDLRPVLSLKSRVVLIRSVEKGDSVGYGRSFVAERDSRIAILPVGYGDGFPRNLSCGGCSVQINQHILPVVGRICMDQIALDITDANDVVVGDTATLIGAKGCDKLSAPVIADASGSISNELLCRMGARLPVKVNGSDTV